MVKIYKRAKIYILSPANLATGGPEALHQLGYNISKYTKYKKVYMQYYPISNKKLDLLENKLLKISEI